MVYFIFIYLFFMFCFLSMFFQRFVLSKYLVIFAAGSLPVDKGGISHTQSVWFLVQLCTFGSGWPAIGISRWQRCAFWFGGRSLDESRHAESKGRRVWWPWCTFVPICGQPLLCILGVFEGLRNKGLSQEHVFRLLHDVGFDLAYLEEEGISLAFGMVAPENGEKHLVPWQQVPADSHHVYFLSFSRMRSEGFSFNLGVWG